MSEPEEKGFATQPRGLVVAGMSGGAGKSVVAVGVTAAFAQQGRSVVPFKKGPDYIDASWLHLAAGTPCYNLDPYLMAPEAMLQSFYAHARRAELIIVEGNRGLYDGVDSAGTYSTAELAVGLGLPLLLVVDCTKTTRTVAAMVLGCKQLDRRVDIRGVVLNRIGSARHETIVRQAVERYAGVPVVGAFPRSHQDVFPQRHLGVTPCQEHGSASEAVNILAERAGKYLDLKRIEQMMAVLPMNRDCEMPEAPGVQRAREIVRIGVIKDAAFQFYYAENLEALERQGAELVEINALHTPELPPIDGLYIGGGFPETSASGLSVNTSFRESVRTAVQQGLPVYAECGGLIYLGEGMDIDGEFFPLVGVFPVRFGLRKKPQAHGYTVLTADGENPYYPKGTEIRGHEFRYSNILSWTGSPDDLAFSMKRGVGFMDGRDGLVHNNVLALYTHVHAVGCPDWAPALIAKARRYRKECSATA